MKKTLFLLLACVTAVVFTACNSGYRLSIKEHYVDCATKPTEEYEKNIMHSYAIANEAMSHFISGRDHRGFNIYTDDYGGGYYDENGVLVICAVGNRKPVVSPYIKYRRVKFSYNFLLSIQNEFSNDMAIHSICCMGICERCNIVTIDIEDKSKITEIITYLKTKNFYNKGAIVFYVGECTNIPVYD